MNTELIKQYKPEFDHQLYGGKLQHRDEFGKWYSTRDIWDSKDGQITAVVIDDEYLPFRKALTEGKTIQLNGTAVNGGYGETWNDCAKENLFIYGINTYRIKPDEPKFKVGDFVRCTSTTSDASPLRITKFVQGNYHVANSNLSFLGHELKPSTPVKGEWCWFWDKCTPHRPTLRQYDIFPEGYGEENMFHDSEQNPFDFCEPFLNSLPSYLKDK